MLNQDHLFSLTDKRVLLTGATGYLGLAMAKGLASLGATVLLNGRDASRVGGVVAELAAGGLSVSDAVFDVNDEAAVNEWFENNSALPLHGLVNNAYSGTSGSIETSGVEPYRQSYEVSMVSAHRLLNAALPALRKAVGECGGASVVNIASMYGVVSPDPRLYPDKARANPPFYGAAKAALIQWTRYAACEFGHEGIRVNAISPGPFPAKPVQDANPAFVSRLAEKVPLGRVGRAEELQGPVSFLISEASTYVNGANLMVDGGWTCW